MLEFVSDTIIDTLIYFLCCFYLHTIYVTNNTSQRSTNFWLSHFLSKFLYFPAVFLESLRIHLCNRCIAVCNLYSCISKSLGCDSANRCDMQIGFLSDSNYCSCVTVPKYIGSVWEFKSSVRNVKPNVVNFLRFYLNGTSSKYKTNKYN